MKIMLSIIFVICLALALWGCVAYIEPDGYYGHRPYYYYEYPYGHGQYYRFKRR